VHGHRHVRGVPTMSHGAAHPVHAGARWQSRPVSTA
jgi:hypothetical protein